MVSSVDWLIYQFIDWSICCGPKVDPDQTGVFLNVTVVFQPAGTVCGDDAILLVVMVKLGVCVLPWSVRGGC